ncbi:MAG TPA: SHOCT domain-containing protein [Solirubrobacteraceae bacterium]|nr:SHOCT domain-containing protein [Solirubrobacteraceae bacterium]
MPTILASTAWEVLWVILIVIPVTLCWVAAIIDLLARRRDLPWWAVGMWLVFILILPVLGMLIYFIARPTLPEEQAAMQAAVNRARADQTASYAGALKDLSDLRERGVITDEEFNTRRADLTSAATA